MAIHGILWQSMWAGKKVLLGPFVAFEGVISYTMGLWW